MDFITDNNRIYAENTEGKVIAEITFPTDNGVATIDHTFVDESLRGQGVAGKLMQAAVNKILADGHQLAATCPYAVNWLSRHPEYDITNTDAPAACKLDGRR